MGFDETSTQSKEKINLLEDALNSGTFKQVKRMLNTLPASDVAHVLESTPPKGRKVLWALIENEQQGEVLQYINDEVRSTLVEKMAAEEIVQVSEQLDTDDLADLLQDLPETVIDEVLHMMRAQDRERVEAVLSFPEDSAGGLMNTDTITVRPDVSLDVVMRYLQSKGEIPDSTDQLFVVDRLDNYIGTIKLTKLLTTKPYHTVDSIMESGEAIMAELPKNEIAQMFERYDLISAPVINEQGKLLGRITIDDVVDVIRTEGDHSFMSMAGLDESTDTFAPVLVSAKKRAIWLGINLITAIVASGVIKIFENTINQLVALAILMPIVASMGGIAGSQTLTLVIRGMALGQVGSRNARWLLIKELTVSSLNGLLWAATMAAIAIFWFDNVSLGLVIASAMVLTLIIAALAGTLVPILLKKFDIDPAVAGGVIVTTVTDVVGFFIFLGLGSIFLV